MYEDDCFSKEIKDSLLLLYLALDGFFESSSLFISSINLCHSWISTIMYLHSYWCVLLLWKLSLGELTWLVFSEQQSSEKSSLWTYYSFHSCLFNRDDFLASIRLHSISKLLDWCNQTLTEKILEVTNARVKIYKHSLLIIRIHMVLHIKMKKHSLNISLHQGSSEWWTRTLGQLPSSDSKKGIC